MWDQYPEIKYELHELEKYIKGSLKSRNKLLAEIVTTLVSSGGKRLRPALVILSARFGDYEREKIQPIAGAIEILHMATLVHDDIVDRAEMRRGQHTVSEKYGIDMAVYTGDFLFTRAVMMISEGVSTDKLDILAKAVKTICEGEVDQFQGRFDVKTSVFSYLKRISKKTAVLFGASCILGAGAAGCNAELIKKLARFGFCYGMAFQIRDDLLDFDASSTSSGKPVGSDLSKGIITLPLIYALHADAKLRHILSKYAGKDKNLALKDVELVKAALKESGSAAKAGIVLERYIERGIEALTDISDDCNKAILLKLIKGLSGNN